MIKIDKIYLGEHYPENKDFDKALNDELARLNISEDSIISVQSVHCNFWLVSHKK